MAFDGYDDEVRGYHSSTIPHRGQSTTKRAPFFMSDASEHPTVNSLRCCISQANGYITADDFYELAEVDQPLTLSHSCRSDLIVSANCSWFMCRLGAHTGTEGVTRESLQI